MGVFIKSPDGTKHVELTQEQINVIVPLLNQRIPRKKINQACLDALEAAGMPAKFGDDSHSAHGTSHQEGVNLATQGREG